MRIYGRGISGGCSLYKIGSGFWNEPPRRKQRGIMGACALFSAASGGELTQYKKLKRYQQNNLEYLQNEINRYHPLKY